MLSLGTLATLLSLDPSEEGRIHLEMAFKYLEEGKAQSDPVQTSEKLYKAVEEAVKAAAVVLGLPKAGEAARAGRWEARIFFSAVRKLAGALGEEFRLAFAEGWFLHVEGFHEARLTLEDVADRVPYIERGLRKVAELVARGGS
ncbi:PaREP1 family protein [Pyrobaculum sp. 3827-6]|uniref:PaREP1 family protein n=1 Tax=Pyrobaculum sp. 3827-6 TaxID=2983604 RepID=UPI0035A96C55